MAINGNIENGTSKKTKIVENGIFPQQFLPFRHLLIETVLGFIFWSLFHGLGPMVWFYPLNQLDISGYEPILAVLLLPIITVSNRILNLIQSRWGLAFLRLLMLAGLTSFQVPSTLSRLVVLAFSTGCAMLVLTATLWSGSIYQRYLTMWGLIFGFIAVLVGRIWYFSINPAWSDLFSNNIVMAIGTVVTFERIFSGFDNSCVHKVIMSEKSWFFSSLRFGSLIYLTHWIFGETSVLCRWVNTDYPTAGPAPIPWGGATFICLCIGVFIGYYTSCASSLWWTFCGMIGFFCLYFLSTYFAFIGGCLLGAYTMSFWPSTINEITNFSPAPMMVTAMITYIIEILFEVWTVAYNFVPGGVYTRERTDFLIFFVMVTLAIPLLKDSFSNISKLSFLESVKKQELNYHFNILFFLGLLLSAGLSGIAYRYNKMIGHQSFKTNSKEFTALIWTFHFGYDNEGWPSLSRSSELLSNTGADVIGLLESDASKPFLGNNDLASWLSEHLNMYVDFGPSTRDHTWGSLLLSRFPIISSQHYLLPSPHGELAPALSATINISGSPVDFLVTHMGNDRDVLDRKLQAEYLSEILRKSENPIVFLGYITSAPGSREYLQLLRNGKTKDIDESDEDRWCEYIFYRGLIRQGYARLSHGGLSDTEIQMAKFEIPKNFQNYTDNNIIVRNPSRIHPSLHFNSKYGSFSFGHNWMHNHRYHMGTPKYFVSS